MAKPTDSPATLVAILWAAHRTGDRDLERHALRELENYYGLKITFCHPTKNVLVTNSREGCP